MTPRGREEPNEAHERLKIVQWTILAKGRDGALPTPFLRASPGELREEVAYCLFYLALYIFCTTKNHNFAQCKVLNLHNKFF